MEKAIFTLLIIIIIAGGLMFLFFYLPKIGNKQLRLFKIFCSHLVPNEYKPQQKHFTKSKFGYTLKYKKNDYDFFILSYNPGWTDFSLVSKEFNVEHIEFEDRNALYFGGDDIGVSRISIQLLNNHGIFEMTHSASQSSPLTKDKLFDLLKKANITSLEGKDND
jgi:hypothetical protein